MTKLVIASRKSKLALWQANYVKMQLQACYPDICIEILGMSTQGDRILDRALSKIGGKGLFVKELELALQDGRADLAVHSMKDVPMMLPEGLKIAAICEREDPRDALVSHRYSRLSDFPDKAVIGTSSLRRESQLRYYYPSLVVKPLRGNIQTRLAKLDSGEFDAIILAVAGLKRLGLAEQISTTLAPLESLPAPGQGALGIEIRSDRPQLAEWLAVLNHSDTYDCVMAERALSRALGGSCRLPLGGYATLENNVLSLEGFVARSDGSVMLTARSSAPREQADGLGLLVAEQLRQSGADALIAEALEDAQ